MSAIRSLRGGKRTDLKHAAFFRFTSTRLASSARLVGRSLFDRWIGLSRTPDKISCNGEPVDRGHGPLELWRARPAHNPSALTRSNRLITAEHQRTSIVQK